MIEFVLSMLITFAAALVFGKLQIKLSKRKHIEQAILSYVDNHNSKKGTPTMGGLMFLIPTAIVALAFNKLQNNMGLVAVSGMLCFGLVGFADDMIKVRHKENQGLKAYQKIIAIGGIAIILSVYAYLNEFIGDTIILPFSDKSVKISWYYLPLSFIVYIATTNAVNLTDGLDGLAGSTSCVSFSAFAIILSLLYFGAINNGNILYANELHSLGIFSYALMGGVLAFLWYNSHPASIFMGDTGSLALGGSIAIIAMFSRNPLIILIVGIVYVLTSLSVIIQVTYFKLTKGKRVFLMSPFHHHLQYKGYKESKIVALYTIVTVVAAVIGILSAIKFK